MSLGLEEPGLEEPLLDEAGPEGEVCSAGFARVPGTEGPIDPGITCWRVGVVTCERGGVYALQRVKVAAQKSVAGASGGPVVKAERAADHHDADGGGAKDVDAGFGKLARVDFRYPSFDLPGNAFPHFLGKVFFGPNVVEAVHKRISVQ